VARPIKSERQIIARGRCVWAWTRRTSAVFFLLRRGPPAESRSPSSLELLGLGVVLPLAAPQFLSRRLWKGPLPWFVVIYGLTVVAFFVTSRYRMPLIPLLLVLASQTCVDVVRAVRTARWGTIARLAAPMALTVVISTSDWIGVRGTPCCGAAAWGHERRGYLLRLSRKTTN
jgi:hypothetical protein